MVVITTAEKRRSCCFCHRTIKAGSRIVAATRGAQHYIKHAFCDEACHRGQCERNGYPLSPSHHYPEAA